MKTYLTQSPASNCGGYRVFDAYTKLPANNRVYATLRAASRAADKLSLEYGAYRYYVRAI